MPESIEQVMGSGTNNAEMERSSYASDDTACFLLAVN